MYSETKKNEMSMKSTSQSENALSDKTKYISYVIFAFFFFFAVTIMVLFYFYQEEVVKEIYKYQEFIHNNVLMSILILAFSHMLASLLFIPSAIFGIACGFIFGIFMKDSWLGFFLCVAVFLSIQGISGVVVFNFSKCLFRERIRKHVIEVNDQLLKLDRVLSVYGTRALFLFRLSPLVPITLFNYILGGFNIGSLSFFISSYGSFPGEMLYCYIGYSMVNIQTILSDEDKNVLMMISTLVGGLIIVLLVLIFGKLSKTQFNRLVEDSEKNMTDIELNLKTTHKEFISNE